MNVAVRKPAAGTDAGALKRAGGTAAWQDHRDVACGAGGASRLLAVLRRHRDGGLLACAQASIRSSRRIRCATASSCPRDTRPRRSMPTLAMKGYFPIEELDTYCKDGGRLAEHPPANLLPGVEAATGSLGHGLPLGMRHGAVGPDQGRDLPRLRAALRRREQRRFGLGSGDVRRRPEARKCLRHRRLQQVAGDRALQRNADAGAARRQMDRVRLGCATRSTATMSARSPTPCSACPTAPASRWR